MKIVFYINYRSSLNDCKLALRLIPNYVKVLNRAATCCFHMKDYKQCIDFCNRILNRSPNDEIIFHLKSQAVIEGVRISIL